MMKGQWLQQLKVMLWKNILIKRRKSKQTLWEIILPIYFVLILGIISITQPKDQKQIGNFPEYSLFDPRFQMNFAGKSQFLVIPDNAETRTIMTDVQAIVQSLTNATMDVLYFSNSTDLEPIYKANSSKILAGVIFNYNNEGTLSYALRFPGENVPSSKQDDLFQSQTTCRGSEEDSGLMSYNCPANQYLYSGFTQLQTIIDTALIRIQSGLSNFPIPNILVQLLPKPTFLQDNSYLQIISSMYFVLAYSPFVNILTVMVVEEKEKKIKEGMKMMGLQSSVFWLSWAIVYVVLIGVVTGIVTGIAAGFKLLTQSNMFLFFIILFLYGLSIVCFSFMITPFFNKARTAGGLASFASILMSLLYLIVSLTRTVEEGSGSVSYKIPVYARWLLGLLSPVAVCLGLDQIIYLDRKQGGANFETARMGDFPLYSPILMLIIDTFIYFILAIYFDNVIPGEYGPRQKPWFIFTKAFWCADKKDRRSAHFTSEHVHIQQNDGFQPDSYTNPANGDGRRVDVEPVTADVEAKLAVRISRLTKTFKNKEKKGETIKAVNELSLNIYEDQITAVLGHNGAGKTTLMNILTGMTSATSGVATIKGLNVSDTNDINLLRSMTGVCPQHNILYDILTCVEHLQLFAMIRGVPGHQIDKEVNDALDSVGLSDQKDVQAEKLSGGQKRKLSVAIAIIGDPKIIFLDEPTAGMDPYSRRHLWSILKEKKKGRVILLTTHFMDEADILADRKAIVNKGALRCCGSSLFLKNKFGLGYHLNLVVTPDSKANAIVSAVSNVVEGAEMNRIHGKELDIMLPYTGVSKFPELFVELEKESTVNQLGIKNYGISMTTLEEVFLRLEEDIESIELEEATDKEQEFQSLIPHKNKVGDAAATMVDLTSSHNPADTVQCVSGRELASQRFWALTYLRILNHTRNPMATVMQLFLPVILVIIGLVLANNLQDDFIQQIEQTLSPLKLNPGYYSNMKTVSGLTFPYNTVPRFLVRDTVNNTDSQSVVSRLGSMFYADTNLTADYYNGTFKLLDQGVYPHYMGIQINNLPSNLSSGYTVLYNDSAIHSIPTTIGIMTNQLLQLALAAAGISNPNSTISVTTIPWLKFESDKAFNTGLYVSTMLVGMAFSFIPSGFSYFVVKDREAKVRTQIRVSGMPFSLYWGSFFIVDFIKFFIPATLMIIAVFAIGVDSLKSGGAVASILITSFLYIPSNILLSYAISFIFDKSETVMGIMPTIIIMLGYIPYLPVSMVDMLGNPDTAKIIHIIVCFLDPAYTIFGAIYYINRVYQTAVFTNTQDDIPSKMYFEMDSNIPICYIASIFHCLVFFILVRILDVVKTGGQVSDAFRLKPILPQNKVNTDVLRNEDEDIVAERERVKRAQHGGLNNQQPVILAEDLRKEFTKTVKGGCGKKKEENIKVAVRNQTFAVDAGEVFGLLGPNGAGKTTTLNMMIADIGPDRGKVMVAGYDIRSSMSDAFQAMGYCPQHDALLDLITLEEHLNCYAKTRGIPADKVPEVTNFFIENLKLEEHRNKRSSKLSGGTKRKLSYCMSMLGRPKIVLLDEPSTGMDPQSKRFLWDTISQSFENSERGAILTTHYMEEADALCNRIAIMVNGKMECIGSSQHLKNKYGKGYLLEIKLAVAENADIEGPMNQLQDYVKQLFPKAVVMEKFSERIQYKVPKSDVTSLSHAFTVLEQGKQQCNIAEYSFSQSTLEQVFLEFAKAQVEGDLKEDEEGAERTRSLIRNLSVENGDAAPVHKGDINAPIRL